MVSIYPSKKLDHIVISTRDDFFRGDLIVKDDGFSLTFKKPSMEYIGKTRRFYEYEGRFQLRNYKSHIPIGRYEYDEDESNEDQKVIFYDI